MKILAFTPLYRPYAGGIEILVEAMAPLLREYDIETVIITNDAPHLRSREILDKTPVYRLPLSNSLRSSRRQTGPNLTAQLHTLQQIVDICRTEKPDLIHVHGPLSWNPEAWYFERLMRKIPPIRLVVTLHGILESKDCIEVLRNLLLTADALTAVSRAVMQSGLDASKREKLSVVIPNGVRAHAPAKRPVHERPKLTCVGRLERNKGFDLAIEALAQVRQCGLDAELALIGQGEERAALETLANSLGLSDRVHFTGVLDHPSTLAAIAASSLVLVPSRAYEGFSLVAAEAAMAGVPCVASRIGGLPETVADGVSGLIVNPDDGGGLAAAVVQLLRDDTRRSVVGENAQARARARFDLERCVQRYAELYASLCGGSATRKAA